MENKKGSIMDIFIWMVIAITVILIFGALIFGFGLANDSLTAVEGTIGDDTNISDVMDDTFGNFNTGLQQLRLLALAIIFGMIITMFVVNFLTKVHPVFFIVYVIIVILAVIVAVPISNAYEELSQNSALGSTFQSFYGMNFILLNLPEVVGFISFIGALFLFIGITRDQELGGGVI